MDLWTHLSAGIPVDFCHRRGTHSRYVIGCCLIPLGIYGLKNKSRRITYGKGCVWGVPSLSALSSLASSDDFNLAPADSANVSFHKYQVPSKKILQQNCRH